MSVDELSPSGGGDPSTNAVRNDLTPSLAGVETPGLVDMPIVDALSAFGGGEPFANAVSHDLTPSSPVVEASGLVETPTCTPEPPILTSIPEGWQAIWDGSTEASLAGVGKHYYWNRNSGVSQWETPGLPLLPGWQAVWDASSQRYFYWCSTTNVVQWEPPVVSAQSQTELTLHAPVDGGHSADFLSAEAAQPQTDLSFCATVDGGQSASVLPGVLPVEASHQQEDLPHCASATGGNTALEVLDFNIGDEPFDPALPDMRVALLTQLGVGEHWTIEKLAGFQGGVNDGVWIAQDALAAGSSGQEGTLVLKLVRGTRKHESLPTEAENLIKLFGEFSSITDDFTVTFPIKILHCLGEGGARRGDLLVMRQAKGTRLAEVMALKWHMGQKPELFQIIERVGARAADFHMRYGGVQHCDLHPSNIFWDEAEANVTLIDVGGMGMPTAENDSQHFLKSVELLAGLYGQDFGLEMTKSFLGGYCNLLMERSEGQGRPESAAVSDEDRALALTLREALGDSVDEAFTKFG